MEVEIIVTVLEAFTTDGYVFVLKLKLKSHLSFTLSLSPLWKQHHQHLRVMGDHSMPHPCCKQLRQLIPSGMFVKHWTCQARRPLCRNARHDCKHLSPSPPTANPPTTCHSVKFHAKLFVLKQDFMVNIKFELCKAYHLPWSHRVGFSRGKQLDSDMVSEISRFTQVGFFCCFAS